MKRLTKIFLFGAIMSAYVMCAKGGDDAATGGGGTTPTPADTTAPTIGTAISFASVTDTTLTVNWGAATDGVTAQSSLQYRLVRATTSAAIDTIAEVDAISGGSLLQNYTANDITQNVTALLSGTTYFFAVVVRDAAGNKSLYAPVSQTTTGVPDTTPPTLSSSAPANTATNVAPCTGNPCVAKISIVFNESMNSALTQTFTAAVWDGTSYVSTSTTNTTFTWSTTTLTDDTLTANIAWYWFPENSQIQYTFAAAGLQDLAGNAIAAAVQRTFTTTTAGQGFTVIDSGQTSCYDNTAVQTCPQATFPGQDANFAGVPALRNFIGPIQHNTTTNYTTTDNATGLVWKSCPEGKTGAGCGGSATTMNWYAAVNQCSALNLSGGYAGKTNWRLPTARELDTLANHNNLAPALDGANFPSANGLTNFWTSTAYIGSAANAWMNVAAFGNTSSAGTKTATTNYVRCVSSPTTIGAVSYTDNGDGTVTDNVSNLRWQKCSYGQTNDATCTGTAGNINWQGALQYCDALSLGTFGNSSNWRLPNANELNSLMDRSAVSPAIKTASFPNTAAAGDYWSSSTYKLTLANAFYIGFSSGTMSDTNKTNTWKARCVSTGP